MRQKFRFIFHPAIQVMLLGALSTLVLFQVDLSYLESKLYDFRLTRGGERSVDTRITLIAIDDQSLERLGTSNTLSSEHFSDLLDQLIAARPLAIGVTTPIQALLPQNFQALPLYKEVDHARRVHVPLLFSASDAAPELISGNSIPLKQPDYSKPLRYIDPEFHRVLAEKSGFHSTDVKAPFYFRYHGSLNYAEFSAVDVLAGNIPKEKFQGKIILIGSKTLKRPSDFQVTPFSREAQTQPQLVIHANVLDSVLNQDSVQPAPLWLNVLITFVSISLVLWSVLAFTPLYGVLLTFASAGLILLIGQLTFDGGGTRGVWILEAQPLVGLFLTYYLAVPYRLIREYKARWEYQKQNEVLMELETLKRNFLSLVTHDLKTPVARIQGLAEVVLSKLPIDLKNELSPNLVEIIRSTDELNHFVSSVLELTRVESEKLSVQLVQKDINDVVENCIESFKNASWAKEISIQADLEPLFPIYFDPRLIQKVIRNLIDNAIKYSPKGASIFVSTYEEGDHVVVSVQDHGFGIPEKDQKHLFSKFFRSKTDQNSTISGTGLGLYLSRYFIESHGGQMRFESHPGSGSVFEILLPIRRQERHSEHTPTFATGLTRFLSKKEKRNV